MDSENRLISSFKDMSLTCPAQLVDFIKHAAQNKSGPAARFAVYTALSKKIIAHLQLYQSKTILTYPDPLLTYIRENFGGQEKGVNKGTFNVTLALLCDIKWNET